MNDLPLDDDIRARQTDPLTLQLELREDEMRCRRADVDADGPQAQPFARDVAGLVIGVVLVTVVIRVTRMR
jgi:hypothetical protein